MSVLEQSLQSIIEEFHADSGSIHLLEDDGVLHLAAAHGLPAPVLDIVRLVPVGKGMAGLAVERAEPVSACNIQTDASGDVRPGARLTGMEGAAVAPMMLDGRAVGALGIASNRQRDFTPDEIASLLAHGSALAEQHARVA